MLVVGKSTDADFETIYSIVNQSSRAYKGVIAEDCWKEPYMSRKELANEIRDGVEFWLCRQRPAPARREGVVGLQERGVMPFGVMGMQHVGDVALVRHAYVLPSMQGKGVGSRLLGHIKRLETQKPLLVGTWKDAGWAIRFYEKHGFSLVSDLEEKDALLTKYWSISRRQTEESVVLVDRRWTARNGGRSTGQRRENT